MPRHSDLAAPAQRRDMSARYHAAFVAAMLMLFVFATPRHAMLMLSCRDYTVFIFSTYATRTTETQPCFLMP